MKFNSFTSKVLTSVAALALTSVWANAAVAKDRHNDKGVKVLAKMTLESTNFTHLFLINGKRGTQVLYLASADGKLLTFDASHPSHLRELSSWGMITSDTHTVGIEPISDQFAVASDNETNDKRVVFDLINAVLPIAFPPHALSDAPSAEIARRFKNVDAYAIDDNKQVLYVAQAGELTVVRFNHPISRDAELFEESYEAR